MSKRKRNHAARWADQMATVVDAFPDGSELLWWEAGEQFVEAPYVGNLLAGCDPEKDVRWTDGTAVTMAPDVNGDVMWLPLYLDADEGVVGFPNSTTAWALVVAGGYDGSAPQGIVFVEETRGAMPTMHPVDAGLVRVVVSWLSGEIDTRTAMEITEALRVGR